MVPSDGIDEARAADAVVAGEDGRDLCTVPADQLGGALRRAREPHVDPSGGAVVGIGGDHPDLAAATALRCDFAGQPVAVGGVDDSVDRTFDGQFDISR